MLWEYFLLKETCISNMNFIPSICLTLFIGPNVSVSFVCEEFSIRFSILSLHMTLNFARNDTTLGKAHSSDKSVVTAMGNKILCDLLYIGIVQTNFFNTQKHIYFYYIELCQRWYPRENSIVQNNFIYLLISL